MTEQDYVPGSDPVIDGLVKRQRERTAYTGSVTQGVKMNPDDYAKAMKLSLSTGVMPDAVLRDMQGFEQEAKVKALSSLQDTHPRTAAFLSQNAELAHDDADTLKRVEDVIPSMSAAPAPTVSEKVNTFFRNLMEGTAFSSEEDAQAIRQAESARIRAAGQMGQDPSTFHTGDATTIAPARIPVGAVRGALRPLSGLIRYGERKTGIDTGLGNMTKRFVETLTPPNPTLADTGVENLASTLGLMVPGMAAGKAVGLLSKIPSLSRFPAAIKAMGPWASAAGMAAPEAAAEAEDAYDANIAKGMNKEDANRIADRVFWSNIALLTVTNKVGWFSRGGTGRVMGSEFIQESGQQAVGNKATDRPMFEGVAEAGLMGAGVAGVLPFIGGLAGGLIKTRRLGATYTPDYNQEFFNALADGAENSKLLARLPEKYQEAVQSMVKDGPVENLRMNPEAFETFYQSKGIDPAAKAAELGVKNYMEAKLSGNDLLIPTAAYATQVAGTDDHAELSRDLRLMEGQMTVREREASAQGGEQLAAMAQEVDAETQAKPEFQAIKEDLKARYVAAGETPAVAETYAMDGAKVFQNMARQAGMNPSELFAQYAPKIMRGDAPKISEVIQEAFTPDTFPAEGVSWADNEAMYWQAERGSEPYRFDKEVDQAGAEPTIESGEGNVNQATGLREVPQSIGRTDGGTVRTSGLETEGAGRGRDLVGAERLRDLAPSPKLQSYQLRNAQVLTVNGVEIAAGPRPPYFSFHGNKAQDGQINLSTSPTNVAGDAVYIAQRHEVASARAHTGDSGQTLSVYVDTRKYAPLDARAERVYNPEELKAFGIEAEGPMNGRELLAMLNDRETPGKGFTDYLKGLGFNGVAYDYTSDQHAAWAVFDPSVFKRVVDTSVWSAKEIARRESFDPEPVGQAVKDQTGNTLYQGQPSQTFKPVDVESPNFKAWFGDSKVVNAKGEPLVSYHGSPDTRFVKEDGIFATLRERMLRYGATPESKREAKESAGYFFVDSQAVAKTYADPKRAFDYQNSEEGVIPVYLSIKNPLVIDASGNHWREAQKQISKEDFIKQAKKDGYDGVIIKNVRDSYDSMRTGKDPKSNVYVAFKPEQIKHATENLGTFDPNNPSILYQSRAMDERSFGSKQWNEYYRSQVGKNARAKADRAKRSEANFKAANSAEGVAEFDYQRNQEAIAEQEAFLSFDRAMSRVATPRGWFSRGADGSFVIGKTPDGDFSTFIHEPAHAYLEMFSDLYQREGASDQLKADGAKILNFLGVDSFEAISTIEHEKWARANEAYAREGKAPSEELRPVFQRFKVWLQSVYRYVSELDVELNDDIRGVFDRMRATDQEIALAHQEVAGPQLFRSAEEAGWTDKEFKAYAIEKDLSIEAAKAEVLAKLNEAAVRDKTQEWKREESEVRDAVTPLVDARPEFVAIRTLRKGMMDDGTPLTLNREALVQQFGEDRVKALQAQHINLYRKEGGADAQTVAEILGWDSGDLLMEVLENTGKRKDAIESATRAVMTERHGDIRYDGTIDDVARQAVANDARSRSLHRELSALRNKVGKATEAKETSPETQALRDQIAELEAQSKEQSKDTKFLETQANALLDKNEKLGDRIEARDVRIQALKDQIQALESGIKEKAKGTRTSRSAAVVPPVQTFRAAAVSIVEAKPIMDLDANSYLNGQRKYSREAFKLNGQGKFQEAADAKQKELLNHFLYLEAIKAKAESEKIATYGKRLAATPAQERIGKAQGGYLEQINAMLERFDFAKVTNKELREGQVQSLAQWVVGLPEGSVEFDTVLMDERYQKNYREMNIAELRAVKDALKNIETLARIENEYLADGRRETYEEIKKLFVEWTPENEKGIIHRDGDKLTVAEKGGHLVRGIDAELLKVEWMVDRFDRGDINGPMRTFIKKTIDNANGRKLDLGFEIFGKIKALSDARPKDELRREMDLTGIKFPSQVQEMTQQQLISWALNLGSIENRNVAFGGEGLVLADGSLSPLVDQAMSKLSSSQWEFIQGVWDIMETLRPMIAEKQKRTTGIEPKWKENSPFSVQTSDGKTVQLRGGYYPLAADRSTTDIGKNQSDPLAVNGQGSRSRPTVASGFTQDVTGATYRLSLDYPSVLSSHLNDAITNITCGEAVAAVNKVITDPDIRRAMEEKLGPEYVASLKPWLVDFVERAADAPRADAVSNFITRFKSGATIATLAGSVPSLLVQISDIAKPLFAPGVSNLELAKARWSLTRHNKELIAEIKELSPNVMRHRAETFNREIRDTLQSRNMFDQKKRAATTFLMSAFAVMDAQITFPTWLAVYRKGLETHGNEAQAITEADAVVNRTFQAGDAANMSAMFRSRNAWMRLFTTFQNDGNTWYGLISSSVASKKIGRISMALMGAFVGQALGQIIKGRGPGDDADDEEKKEWAIKQAMLVPVGSLPFLGDAFSTTFNVTGFGSSGDFTSSMMGRTGQAFAKPFLKWDDMDWQDIAITEADALGTWMGIPGTAQALRSWKYVHKVQKGEENPENVGEFIKGVALGAKPKGQK